jgi:AcrR family transcriptional regulator
MVASVARRGFAATRLSDLTEASGISSKSFYELFPDKDSCLLATVEALLDGPFDVEDTAAFAEAIAEQPAAAKLCLIEAHAGDARVRERLRKATSSFEAKVVRAARVLPGGDAYPEEMISAYVGAIAEIARRQLRLGSEAELPDLLRELVPRLIESYPPPPEPLRMATRRHRGGSEAPAPADHAERILQAMTEVVAEQGYAKTTIDQIVKKAGISASMFYAHFGGKEDALLAAIDSAGAQIVAAAVPAFRRSHAWPHAVRAGLGAFFNLLASRPAVARLMIVEVYAAGPAALQRREETLRPLGVLWAEARRHQVGTPAIVFEALLGAILHLAYRRIETVGPEGLPALAPIASYLSLVPFTGAEVATTAANEEGRTPLSRVLDPEAIRAAAMQPVTQGALSILTRSEATVATIAKELELPEPAAADHLEALARVGLIKLARKAAEPMQDRYRSNLGEVHTEDWARLSLAEREEITEQIRTMVDADLDRSIESGTFEQRPERVLTRSLLVLDEQGWNELSELQSATLAATMEIEAKSRARLAETGDERIDARAVLMLFEMPPDEQPSVGALRLE